MKLSSFSKLLDKHKVVFLDSYGVLKNHQGLIEGVPEIMALIKKKGIPFKILTNDASRNQQKQVDKFENIGLKGLHSSDIITSGMMARFFLENKIRKGTVAYMGTPEAAEDIIEAKLNAIPVSEVTAVTEKDIAALVFLDDEGFDWNADINKCVNLLRKKNIPAIVANSDKIYPVANNDVALATGGIAQLVEIILGRSFMHFGKPDSQMFSYAFDEINLKGAYTKKDILMVGDTLHTDILGGNRFGVRTMLVLSGNTRKENLNTLVKSSGIIPDYVGNSIVD